ncbi:MAG: hypothetical protein CV045_10550 [Cyanobacteria bacterium M5B4]|nr:MAG: hypothetical protein CV045_10550 [Cyanobacteria bacterium M5B4]
MSQALNQDNASTILAQSFDIVRQDESGFARSVYDLFFLEAPEAKALFSHTDWSQQQKMLMGALTLMVKNLDNPSLFRITMKSLAERHVRYGIKASYFAPFSNAVLKSLQQQLQDKWNTSIKDSWEYAFDKIKQLMLEAGVN